MNVYKHTALAIGGSFLTSCVLVGLFTTITGLNDFLVPVVFSTIFLYVGYVFGRTYLIDAPAPARYASQERVSAVVCFFASTLLFYCLQEISVSGWPTRLSGYGLLTVSCLLAWGSYRVLKRAIIKQYVFQQGASPATQRQPQTPTQNSSPAVRNNPTSDDSPSN